jgi:predicted metal-dependent enzyme (double-stranded beta helix superfamily)
VVPRVPTVSISCQLNLEQVHSVANAVPDRYRALIYVLAYGGLRRTVVTVTTAHRIWMAVADASRLQQR